MRPAACVLALLSLATITSGARTQAPAARTTTTGVLIDVSVLDRQGQPILDLSSDDFELSEDGVRQRILSAALVHGGAVRPAVPSSVGPAAAGQPRSSTEATAMPAPFGEGTNQTPTVTAILFDRLSPETVPLARRAALAYLSTLTGPHDYAGVFLADISLRTFQPFTNQQEMLKGAVDRLAGTAPANLTRSAELSRNTRIQDLDPSQPVTAGAESGSGWTTALEREKKLSKPDPEGLLRKLELRMWEGYAQFLTEYAGQSSLAGLRSVVSGLSLLSGRKTILYFTEDLPITSTMKAKFDALIGEANRGNVTIYPVDAVGLRVHSKELEVSQKMSVAGAQGVGGAKREEGAWTKELERQEEYVSSRPTAVLGRLAKETGGFLLENTNDLGKGVARMQQERTTYYLLAYQPTNGKMDGRFRRVSVKVKRSKVTVRSRPGYLAVK